MTPREELEELILDADSFDRAAKRTRGFAIGRWVSVEERLPDDQQTVITQWSNGYISYYTFWSGYHWCVKSTDSEITHWLELELPIGKEVER